MTTDDGPLFGEVEGHDGDLLEMDVLPHVELGPVGQGKDPNALALVDPSVVDVPEFGTLILGVPTVMLVAEGEHALLGTGLLFVSPCPAKGGVETVLVQRLLESVCLHQLGVLLAVVERMDVVLETLLVDVNDHIEVQLPACIVLAKVDHLAELPRCVDVHQWKGRFGRVERLLRQAHHYGGVLADGVQHDGSVELGSHLAHDMDALGFQLLEVGQVEAGGGRVRGSVGQGKKTRSGSRDR